MGKITHGMCNTKEYYAYRNMLNRCYYKKTKSYALYGKYGITVCDSWKENFINFFNDMGICPINKHSLDRIDNTKGYYKENCRWVTNSEQCMNRGNKKEKKKFYKGVSFETKKKLYRARITINGKTKNLGRRKSAREAAILYDKAAEFFFGEFALTNKKMGLL